MLKPFLLGAAVAGLSFVNVATKVDARTVNSVKSTTSHQTPITLAQASEATSEIEQSIFQQINEYRVGKGLPKLTWNSELAKQARSHSENMANKATPFGHGGFNQRAKDLTKAIGYERIAENVAYMTKRRNLADVAVTAWINSGKHRHNIEGNFSMTGIGVSHSATGEVYFTEIFVHK
jgi:uncharacterized protein YkwD